jgi:hypothetical protein
MAKKIALLSVGVATLLMPVVTLAQIQTLPPSPVTSVRGIIDVLNFVLRIIFTVLMIAAIGFILYAAFKYLTAMGDPGKVAEAHKALLWAAVAIAVALVATGVRAIVESILGRQG